MKLHLICIAGAESTGKSWLAYRLAAHFGIGHVTEYARGYCADHGNSLSLEQLLHIAQTQDEIIRTAMATAAANGQQLVIADTDALVTSIWAGITHPAHAPDAWFASDLVRPDLTLVTENDLPWRDDGVRIQRADADRQAFTDALVAALDKRGHRWGRVGGLGEVRFNNALRQITSALTN
jgi:NadR type nicotinamide-nucleotide adenylyltransferase